VDFGIVLVSVEDLSEKNHLFLGHFQLNSTFLTFGFYIYFSFGSSLCYLVKLRHLASQNYPKSLRL
jgi:hypothetical protein